MKNNSDCFLKQLHCSHQCDKGKVSLGVVGFGAVGKSVIEVLTDSLYTCQNTSLHLWDRRELTTLELRQLREKSVSTYSESKMSLEQFCLQHTSLIVSPGIDVRVTSSVHHKMITEIDMFSLLSTSSVVAITGTLGKTSLAKLLAALFRLKVSNVLVGNSWKPMLNAVNTPQAQTVVEVSSFQLEYASFFAPDCAILANLYPNHLDRHGTFAEYIEAKFRIFRLQKVGQISILSWQAWQQLSEEQKVFFCTLPTKKFLIVNCNDFSDACIQAMRMNCSVVSSHDQNVFYWHPTHGRKFIFSFKDSKWNGFASNWVIAVATLYAHFAELCWLRDALESGQSSREIRVGSQHEHRLELCSSIDEVDIYNDSKATVVQATQAAVANLARHKRPIFLLLGGSDKGVDRTSFFQEVAGLAYIKQIIFFGPAFVRSGKKNAYSSLQQAVDATLNEAQPGDQILFSPSGASFDLFNNFEQRGKEFKALVRAWYKEKKEHVRGSSKEANKT